MPRLRYRVTLWVRHTTGPKAGTTEFVTFRTNNEKNAQRYLKVFGSRYYETVEAEYHVDGEEGAA